MALNKKRKSYSILALAVTLLVSSLALGGCDAKKDKDVDNEVLVVKNQEIKVGDTFKQAFSSGHYISGLDFPAGTYDVFAVSGGGNVSSTNLLEGGMNSMMATKDFVVGMDDDMYVEALEAIDLPEGVRVFVDGMTVEMTSDQLSQDHYAPRVGDDTESIHLQAGLYVAGTDFEPGVYTLRALAGQGNVSTSNALDGGVIGMMGIESDPEHYYHEKYSNIELPEGTSLTIEGLEEVALIPVQ